MTTRVGLGTTCYPSLDGDTCRVGCEPRVQSVTAWREKKPSYKGKLNRICRGTFFITAHCLGLSALYYGSTEYSFLSIFWCSCYWLERRNATGRRGATLCFSGSQRGYLWRRIEGHVVSSWWGSSWRGNALTLGQPAGTVAKLVNKWSHGFRAILVGNCHKCIQNEVSKVWLQKQSILVRFWLGQVWSFVLVFVPW